MKTNIIILITLFLITGCSNTILIENLDTPIILFAKSTSNDLILKGFNGNIIPMESVSPFTKLINENFIVGDTIFPKVTNYKNGNSLVKNNRIRLRTYINTSIKLNSKVIAVNNNLILFGNKSHYYLIGKGTVEGRSLINTFKKGDIIK